jgi:dienelactone hydrolase
VIGLVTDGAFDELPNVIRNISSKLPLPRYLQRAAFAIAGRIVGSEPKDVRPILFAPNLKVPCLFLHGERDRLVPRECAAALAMVTDRGELELYDGSHDEPCNPEMQRRVMAFLDKTATS